MTRPVTRLMAVLAALVTLIALGIGGASTAMAKPRPANLTADVTGTLQDGTGAVDGVFTVTRFTNDNGTLAAVGTLTGTITNDAGDVLATATNLPLTLPVNTEQSTGSCQILDLVLGPLDLDLLGLQVHLDTVHLNITAQRGPGNLLGNLLCAVAGLLDGTGSNTALNQLVNLLNQLLGAL